LLRLVARTLVDNAIDGDTTAARECFDRMDGKVPQGVNETGQVRGNVTFTAIQPAASTLRREVSRSSAVI